MTNKEILEKAIQKAIDGGWKSIVKDHRFTLPTGVEAEYVEPFIFNHDFAKALWGDLLKSCSVCYATKKYPCKQCGAKGRGNWASHLQQMVISDDPIKYLGDNI